MALKIRPSVLKDAAELIPLLMQLGYPLSLKDLQKRLQYYCTSPDYAVLVAEKEGRLVGCIALSIRESFVKIGKIARIEALIIKEGFKRQGIGGLLTRHIEEKAKNAGCYVIELTSGLRRSSQGTHDFYASLGYKNEGHYAKLYLRKSLK